MPIFGVKSVKIYIGQKKFTRVYPWDPWQIWGMYQFVSCQASNALCCNEILANWIIRWSISLSLRIYFEWEGHFENFVLGFHMKNKHELCWNYLHFLHLLFFFLVAVWGEFICIRGPIGVGVIVSGQTNAPSFVPKNSIHEPRKTEKWRKRSILLGQTFPSDMFLRV